MISTNQIIHCLNSQPERYTFKLSLLTLRSRELPMSTWKSFLIWTNQIIRLIIKFGVCCISLNLQSTLETQLISFGAFKMYLVAVHEPKETWNSQLEHFKCWCLNRETFWLVTDSHLITINSWQMSDLWVSYYYHELCF